MQALDFKPLTEKQLFMSLPKFLSTKPVLGSLALLTMALAALFITLAMPHSAQAAHRRLRPLG